MTYYLKQANVYKPTDEASLDIHTLLPAGNYIIKQDQWGNMFFELVDSFELPAKRYGDNVRNTDRIMNTFLNRDVSTGVMLAGEKGSGKSLLAKTLSATAAEQDIPTLIINAPWCGDSFNTFIQDIQQPCIVLFDEFEKVYDRDQQESILTLLDGVFPTKKLFVFTCNDKWRVDQHMRNRPGRIFYMIDFKGLSIEFIEEYCNDNLINKSHIDTICKLSNLFSQFNFDMLKALVEEMNRYNETPQEALELLNAKPEFDEGNKFKVQLQIGSTILKETDLYNQSWAGNPLNSKFNIEYKDWPEHPEDSEDYEWDTKRFAKTDLKNVDAKTGSFVFMNVDGDILTLIKEKEVHPGNLYYMDL